MFRSCIPNSRLAEIMARFEDEDRFYLSCDECFFPDVRVSTFLPGISSLVRKDFGPPIYRAKSSGCKSALLPLKIASAKVTVTDKLLLMSLPKGIKEQHTS